MFKKILVPLDGSENAYHALELGASLAGENSADLFLVHAVEVPAYGALPGDWVGWSATTNFVQDALKAVKERGRRILSAGEARVEKHRLRAKSVMPVGSPVASICEAAEKEGCDLIVMGSRGLSDLKGMFLGSVSHGVLQRCSCPVLLVKEPPPQKPEKKQEEALGKQ